MMYSGFPVTIDIDNLGMSSGIVVKGGRGCEYTRYTRRILFTLIRCNNCIVCLDRHEVNK